MQALRIQAENYALHAIEFLDSEIVELDKIFQQNNLEIGINGNWDTQHKFYNVEMSAHLSGSETALFKMMLIPLKANKLHVIIQHDTESKHHVRRSYEVYKELNDVDSCNELLETIRVHIEGAVPEHIKENVVDIIRNPSEPDYPENYITDKYFSTPEKIKKDDPKALQLAKDRAFAAYQNSFSYQ